MKRGSRKLKLERETLVALTPDALDAVAGGITVPTTLPQTRVGCPSQLSVCPTRQICPTREVFCVSIQSAGGNSAAGNGSQGGGK
jgi:hypothetical protein